MKKVILILLLAPVIAFAQKPVKPNLNKALSLMQAGKLDEAKDMIDAATTYEKTMNDGKTWYYRGLIYASIDTTSNETYKTLSPNALDIAIESFKKADQLQTGGKEYFINDPNDIASAANNTKTIQLERLANHYLDQSIKLLQQDEPDYMGSIAKIGKTSQVFENLIPKYANDTLAYYVLATAAQAAERYDTAITAANKVLKLGGKGEKVEATYNILFRIYSGPKKDKEKALSIISEAKAKFPLNTDFARLEIGLLVETGKEAEAKKGLENAIVKEPNDPILHFYLGYVNLKLNNLAEAKSSFETALKFNPKYFDAQFYIAKIVGEDAKAVKRQIVALGITAADKKKKQELDVVYVQKLKIALPYWEKAEKLNASDHDVLDELYSIYSDLGMEAGIKRIEKRYKELGIDN